jgi:gliding motility associated protien GldN
MKLKQIAGLSLVFLIVFAALKTSAQTPQRPVKRRPKSTSAYGNSGSAYGNTSAYGANSTKADTSKPTGSAYGNNGTSAYSAQASNAPVGIDTTLPITVVKSTSGGLMDSVKISLRNDASVDLNLIKERTPLPYENIREDDAVYRVRVWRTIDAREKMNQAFRYAADGDNGNQRFISILLRAIKNGDVTAFSGDDDRFTTPITPDDAVNAFGGGFDTSKTYDLQGNVKGYTVSPKAVEPDSIYKFRVKEEWVFDKETSRLYVRILGIAPVYTKKLSTGEPIGDVTAWWVYYPDLRPTLSRYQVYNPKNFGANMTWEELFESRMFSSYITQSSMDNPSNTTLAAQIKDPLFRLLQGEKVKDKIFDYEQSLWAY